TSAGSHPDRSAGYRAAGIRFPRRTLGERPRQAPLPPRPHLSEWSSAPGPCPPRADPPGGRAAPPGDRLGGATAGCRRWSARTCQSSPPPPAPCASAWRRVYGRRSRYLLARQSMRNRQELGPGAFPAALDAHDDVLAHPVTCPPALESDVVARDPFSLAAATTVLRLPGCIRAGGGPSQVVHPPGWTFVALVGRSLGCWTPACVGWRHYQQIR